jgi:geranylgeranylglycerol-phosphate geranylgeranyltransferase
MSRISLRQENERHNEKQRKETSFLRSQLLLFHSRKKWGLVYALATLAGLFCTPEGIVTMAMQTDPTVLISRVVSLPLVSFTIIVAMYVLNDLVDADLDRANGKKRPIPSGQVSKRQVLAFIGLTNGAGILLAALTLNPASAVIAIIVTTIGILYSAPKISLKDRFIVKTLSIALAMSLCALLGSTLTFDLRLEGASISNSSNSSGNASGSVGQFAPVYMALMLGTMIFITSPFNDMGDIVGDKAAGRRTIPIVIGRENTVKMAIVFAMGMVTVSWLCYGFGVVSMVASITVSLVSSVAAINIFKVLRRLDDIEYVRKKHKMSYPLHLMLQLAIVVGMLVFI